MSTDFRAQRNRIASVSSDIAQLLQGADLSEPATEAGRQALREAIDDLRDLLTPRAAIAPPPPPDILAAARGLAIVVGHSADSPGASAVSPPFPPDNPATIGSERSEYVWNTDLAMKIKALADAAGVRCGIFFRDGVGIEGAYRAVREWGAEATVELHFNAADGRARGSLVLYGAEASLQWAKALQKAIVKTFDRQGRSEDRGVFIPGGTNGYDRGLASVTQLHPSALIEPFFGDSPSDAALGMSRKEDLARAVLNAFAAFTGRAEEIPSSSGVRPPTAPVTGSLLDGPLLRELIAAYRLFTPVVADLSPGVVAKLKGITLAQWILESGWARSDLAAKHFNFGGMKALSEVDRILREVPASKVEYKAHDGIDTYLKFASVRDFLTGYFMFLERSPYRGWKEMAARSPHDFIRFIGRTWTPPTDYASNVITIEQSLVAAGIVRPDGTLAEHVAPDDGLPPPPQASGALLREKISAEGATTEFLELVASFGAEARLARVLPVVVAQCGLESNWGRSDLARVHANFAGIPWTDLLAEIAAPVPHPADPARGKFCRFLSPAMFARAFLRRLDNDPAFAGWIGSASDGAAFTDFLARTWRPTDPDYARKISTIVARIAAAGDGAEDLAPEGEAGAPRGTALTGLVLQITRHRVEKRPGQSERTVGTYQLFRDGQPMAGLSGMVCESRGPGDNSETGKQRGARIAAGTYPVLTHSGSRMIDGVTAFKTIGFTSDARVRQPSMPSLRVGDTRSRSGILLHPGQGWLWSIGCMNPSDDLADARSDMVYGDSRGRVIALIEAIKQALGSSFPAGNNQMIPKLKLEVIGEPGPAGSDVLAEGDFDADAYAHAELAIVRRALEGDALAAPLTAGLYDALACGMEAAARLGIPEDGAVDRVAASGVKLTDVRSATGETLWTPFALAVSAAAALDDARRAPVIAQLDAIAATLDAAGVPLNDAAAYRSAMTTAAIGNDPSALAALTARGARVDAFDGSGITPLHAAAYNGAPNAVRFLLERGADPFLTVRAPADVATGDAELPPVGSDAAGCAAEGALLTAGDPARLQDFETISALVWDALNPRPL